MMALLPITAAVLIGAAFFFKKKKVGMTAERELVYQKALRSERDPMKLRELANAFRAEGLDAEATLLDKRAKLRELPAEVKLARRNAFKQAMNSKDINTILAMADAYGEEGATGAEAKLREYAKALEQGR